MLHTQVSLFDSPTEKNDPMPFGDSVPDESRVDKWKAELSKRLNDYIAAKAAYDDAVAGINVFYVVGNESQTDFDAVSIIFGAWLSGVCQKWNDRTKNDSVLNITADTLPSSLKALRFRFKDESHPHRYRNHKLENGDDVSRADYEVIVDWFLGWYDFDGLEAALTRIASKIEAKGFEESASYLASKFYLTDCRDNDPIKKVSGRIVCELWRTNSCFSHDRVKNLAPMLEHIRAFEKESGDSGIEACINQLIAVEDACEYEEHPLSRTMVAKGSDCEGVIFKEKFKLRMVPSLFESLVSFTVAHHDYEMRELDL